MSLQRPAVLVLSPGDEVAVALRDLGSGETIEVADRALRVRDPIPAGHKLALGAIGRGALVHKYGEPIGRATGDIAAGEHVHVHNLVSARLPGQDA
jgi:altronate dehydratase